MKINNIENNINNNNNEIILNELLLCNKCLSIPKIDINPYDHTIYTECPNNHKINSISLDLYLKEELNKSILCSICNKNNNISNLLYCKTCLSLFCQNCLDIHNKSHIIIKYSDINVLCSVHQIKNNIICKTCNKEICNKCLEDNEHKNHEVVLINEFLNIPENRIDSKLLKILNENNKKEKKQFEVIKDMLIKKINKITEIKNIENNIDKRMLNNIASYPNNYNSIFNINNMIKNKNISEDNYYESISHITNILENYLKNGNSGKDKLILMKRQNLKNLFFLIVFFIIVIIAMYFFSDNSNYKMNIEKENNIHFEKNSNLLKLTEIIENEEQENKINDFIIKSASELIGQYNNLFNDNTKYNISLNYKLIYKGTRDGDNANSFHKRCDNKNNLLFMIETSDKTKFGFFSFNGYKDINNKNIWNKNKNICLFKFDKDNKNINFIDNINDCDLYWHSSSIIEIKRKDKNLIYISDNFLNENNFGLINIKECFINENQNFEFKNENQKFTLKDIEIFQIFFKKN